MTRYHRGDSGQKNARMKAIKLRLVAMRLIPSQSFYTNEMYKQKTAIVIASIILMYVYAIDLSVMVTHSASHT